MTQQHSTAIASLSARNASYDTLTGRLTELDAKLTAARGTAHTVTARADELTRTADHLKEAAEASRILAAAVQALQHRTSEAAHAAQTRGFDTALSGCRRGVGGS
ncbi:hypothetical protein [Streptomyces sp. NPDC005969]|uniref:hypothetical protein n=1 Tax=Streptomyces sp. NPDC005969 TaxID=3156722 RepID=UPI0033EF0B37